MNKEQSPSATVKWDYSQTRQNVFTAAAVCVPPNLTDITICNAQVIIFPKMHAAPSHAESVKKLEEIVIAQINCLSSAYMDKEMLENGINPCCCLYKQQDRIQSHIDACKNKAAEYTNAIRQLYMDKVKGIISEKDFMEMSENFTLEKHRMTHIIDDNQNLLKKIEYEIKNSSSSAVLAEKYTNLRSLNREIVDYLIDYIYVGRRIIGTGDIPIEIHWRF